MMLRYVDAIFNQISQLSACHQRHNIEQQVCSWLLLSSDRTDSNNITVTQEAIAHLLGVRRESVSDVTKKLRKAGIINYRRAYLELKNKGKLKAKTCECYAVIKVESEYLIRVFQAA